MKGIVFGEGERIHVAGYVGEEAKGVEVMLFDADDWQENISFFLREDDLHVLVDLLLRARKAIAEEYPIARCSTQSNSSTAASWMRRVLRKLSTKCAVSSRKTPARQ
jgi:hypothetical protein